MSLTQSSVLLIVVYFIIMIALSTRQSAYVPGKTIYLLRALFPSWKFFEDVCQLPVLYYRFAREGEEFCEWQNCFQKPKRHLSAVIFNPQGNLLLACNGLLQQLESDIEELDASKADKFDQSVSYRLTKNLVIYQVSKQHQCHAGFRYQFKVASLMQGSTDETSEIFLTSPIHQA